MSSLQGKQESAVDARARVAAARKRKEEEEKQLEERMKQGAKARLKELEERIARCVKMLFMGSLCVLVWLGASAGSLAELFFFPFILHPPLLHDVDGGTHSWEW